MSGLPASPSPASDEKEVSKMDVQNLNVMALVRQAAKRARQEAARAYMRALHASVAVGETVDEMQHDHRQFYLRGLDLMEDNSSEVPC